MLSASLNKTFPSFLRIVKHLVFGFHHVLIVIPDKRSDKCRQLMPSVFPLAFTVLLSIILSLLVLIPMVEILYVTFIIMTCFRSFLYAIAAAFISSM